MRGIKVPCAPKAEQVRERL